MKAIEVAEILYYTKYYNLLKDIENILKEYKNEIDSLEQLRTQELNNINTIYNIKLQSTNKKYYIYYTNIDNQWIKENHILENKMNKTFNTRDYLYYCNMCNELQKRYRILSYNIIAEYKKECSTIIANKKYNINNNTVHYYENLNKINEKFKSIYANITTKYDYYNEAYKNNIKLNYLWKLYNNKNYINVSTIISLYNQLLNNKSNK